jgi:AcrR family transcriptional regulator
MKRYLANMQTARSEPDTRQRIISAARQQFFAQGFRGVTMDDLARELAMSKKTLYAHFSTKNALLEAMLFEKFQSVEADLASVSSECSSDFATGLQQMLACVQRHTGEVQPAFVRDIQREVPELFQAVETRRREVIGRYFTKLLDQGRRDGLIRRDISVPIIIEILLGTMQAIMNPPKLAELNLTLTKGFTTIVTVILEGVITQQRRPK